MRDVNTSSTTSTVPVLLDFPACAPVQTQTQWKGAGSRGTSDQRRCGEGGRCGGGRAAAQESVSLPLRKEGTWVRVGDESGPTLPTRRALLGGCGLSSTRTCRQRAQAGSGGGGRGEGGFQCRNEVRAAGASERSWGLQTSGGARGVRMKCARVRGHRGAQGH